LQDSGPPGEGLDAPGVDADFYNVLLMLSHVIKVAF